MTSGRRYDLAAIERLIVEREQESEVLDYKVDPEVKHDPKPREKLASITAKAVCAFGNSGGGELVLGIDEDREGFPEKTTPPGLPATLDEQPIVERIDRFVTNHVFPRPSATPYAVPIDGERSYVVVEVLPRGPGPYRVIRTKEANLDDRYFVRQGRSSVIADHYQLRQLFAEAAEGGARVEKYLERQGFGDDAPPDDFGQRPPAFLLSEDGRTRKGSYVVLTLIPEYLRGEIFDPDVIDAEGDAVHRILALSGASSRFGHEARPTPSGRAIEERHGKGPLLMSYLHVHRNGYIEAAHARATQSTDHGKFVLADGVEALLNPLLPLAKRLYDEVGVRDRILVAMNIRDARDSRLGRYIENNNISGGGNCAYRNLSIVLPIPVDDLAKPETLGLLDRRLANAFGIEDGLVLERDGQRRPPRVFM